MTRPAANPIQIKAEARRGMGYGFEPDQQIRQAKV
jgi:hypothetical protein